LPNEYLSGTGDEISATPASLEGRARQRWQELDCRLAAFVRADAEGPQPIHATS
jgi:hypothetical protein